jgi:hypothetical protein
MQFSMEGGEMKSRVQFWAPVVAALASAPFWHLFYVRQGTDRVIAAGSTLFAVIILLVMAAAAWRRNQERDPPTLSMLIHRLVNDVQRWWHAGEEDAVVVFRKVFRARLVLLICFVIAFPFIFPKHRLSTFSILAAVVIPRAVAESRRAHIFTSTEFIYRPPFGPVQRVRLSQIKGIRRSKVTISFALEAYRVTGILLTLGSGESKAFPLDFKQGSEILRRLSTVTGLLVD